MRFCSIILIICALSIIPVGAMPLHPETLARIQSGDLSAPYSYSQSSAIHTTGVDQPLRTRSSLDETDTPATRLLTLLVYFQGESVPTTSPSSLSTLVYGSGTNSVADYFRECSANAYQLSTLNAPTTLGWLQLPQTAAYYINGRNGMGSYPNNTQKMCEDALVAANAQFPSLDFAQYDTNGDGYIDGVLLVHSGTGGELSGNANHIHSHMWSVGTNVLVDGVRAYTYCTVPEYWSTPSTAMTIGVIAHELGHLIFGLPDLYDYDNSSYGLGKWSLMAYGSWNGSLGASPSHPDAYCSIAMGFNSSTTVSTNRTGQTITPNQIYRLNGTGASTEYILAENRQRTGFDAQLPGAGLLIYHIDAAKYGNNSEWYPGVAASTHYQVALEQADGSWHLEHRTNNGDGADPFPGTGNRTSFDANSTPNSRRYDNSDAQISISNIRVSGSNIIADLNNSAPPSVVLTAPNGGQQWAVGTDQTINWSAHSSITNVHIQINRNYPSASGNWYNLFLNTPNDGSQVWHVAGPLSPNTRIRILAANDFSRADTSDANIALVSPLTLTSSAPVSPLSPGATLPITWSCADPTIQFVHIQINRTYPSASGNWSNLILNAPNTGSASWTVAPVQSSSNRIRIIAANDFSLGDSLNANFTVLGAMTVTSPNGGESYAGGSSQTFTWTINDATIPSVHIQINRTYPSSTWENVVLNTPNDGSQSVILPTSPTSRARFRVISTTNFSVGDSSDANFTILNPVTVTSQLTPVSWSLGSTQTITWTTSDPSIQQVHIQINRSYPSSSGNWYNLILNAPNTGTASWTVSGSPTGAARIRVLAVNNFAYGDTCNGTITIPNPVTVTAPNTSQVWQPGSTHAITWSVSDPTVTNVHVQINRSFPSSAGNWYNLFLNAPNNGSVSWVVSGAPSPRVRFRVLAANNLAMGDTSDRDITIPSGITITSPNGGEVWSLGTTQSITWNVTDPTISTVHIQINRKYPSSTSNWYNLILNAPNTGSASWLVSGALSSTTRIRIIAASNFSIGDSSDANLAIVNLPIIREGAPTFVSNPSELSITPNPCNAQTRLSFTLPQPGRVTLTIYNALGMQVAQPLHQFMQSGNAQLEWIPGNLPAGLYIVKLETPSKTQFDRIILLK